MTKTHLIHSDDLSHVLFQQCARLHSARVFTQPKTPPSPIHCAKDLTRRVPLLLYSSVCAVLAALAAAAAAACKTGALAW
jgi:hypothetical protein